MFVRSRMQKEVTYRKNGSEWVLKPGQTVVIDESKVSAMELLKLYGTRIEVITREKLSSFENKIPVKLEIKEKPIKVNLENEKLIDDILTKITSENKKEEPLAKDMKEDEERIEVQADNKNVCKLKVENILGDLCLTPVEDNKDAKLVENKEVKKEEPLAGEMKKVNNAKEVKQRKPRAKKTEKVTTPKKRTRRVKAK